MTMNAPSTLLRICAGLLILAPVPSLAMGDDPRTARTIVVISDLHMGLGCKKSSPSGEGCQEWHRKEDFRWPRALKGFLSSLNADNGSVDLVIAGDFLELWQPPDGVQCDEDLGCTVEQVEAITDHVLAAHLVELAALARFAEAGDNCLYIIPGNHDAGLMVDSVWQKLAVVLGEGCVRRVTTDRWQAGGDRGRVVVEHGHQIGEDPNRYSDWPDVTQAVNGKVFLVQPWGERFVQTIYNDEEESYPLIDNLSPSSAGARHRLGDRDLAGKIKDVGRFLKLNVLDTSFRQKLQVLGRASAEVREGSETQWDLRRARGLGSGLLLGGLPAEDPVRRGVLSAEPRWKPVRDELEALAMELTDEEVLALCAQLELSGDRSCRTEDLGAALETAIFSRPYVMGRYVRTLKQQHTPWMRTFVYGHTHSFEQEWVVEVPQMPAVTVLNTGAFQRLIDDHRLSAIAQEQNKSVIDLLKSDDLHALPPCYTFARLTPTPGGNYRPSLRTWYMGENGEAGVEIDPCDSRCPSVGHGCSLRPGG